MKKVRKTLYRVVAAILLLIVALFLFMQTSWFKAFLKDELIKISGDYINGTLVLEQLSGNFFTHIELSGLALLTQNEDTVLSFEKLALKYSPLELINGNVVVDLVHLQSPRFHLKQYSDSTWNFEKLIIPSEPDTTTKESSPTNLTFWLHSLNIKQGNISIQMPDSIVPKTITDLNIELAALYSAKKAMAQLKEFNFISEQPHLELKNFQLNVETDFSKWQVTNFNLATAQNNIQLKGGYTSLDEFDILLTWDQLFIREFYNFIEPLPLAATPHITFSAEAKNQQTAFNLSLANNQETITIEGKIHELVSFLEDSLRAKATVDVNLGLREIIPHHWVEMDSLPLVINADFNVKGNGLTDNAEPLNLEGKFYNSLWENHTIESGFITGNYNNGDSRAEIELLAPFGQLNTTAQVNLNSPLKDFSINLLTHQLALHQLLPEMVDSTEISLDITASGKGLGTDQLTANFSALIYNTIAEFVPIDTLQLLGSFQDNLLNIHALIISNTSVKGALQGFYQLDGELQGNFEMKVDNLDAFAHYFSQPTQWNSLNIQAAANGNMDSLLFDANVQLNNLKLDTILNVQKFDLMAHGAIVHQKPYVTASIESHNIKNDAVLVELLNLDAQLNDSLWNVDFNTTLDKNIALSMAAEGNIANLIKATLNKLDVVTEHHHLLLNNPAYITYGDSIVQLEKLQINNSQDSEFMLAADAFYNLKDSIFLHTQLKGFNLETLHSYGLMENALAGRVDATIHAEAYKNHFNVTGSTSLKELIAEPLAFKNIAMNFNYPGDSLRVNAAMYSEVGDSIALIGIIPLKTTLQDSLHVAWDETFSAKILAHNAPLKNFLMDLKDFAQPDALLNINILAEGTMDEPKINGYLNIDKGILPLPKYGINYKDILLRLSIDEKQINMDSLFVRQRGYMLVTGGVKMKESITSGEIESSTLTVKARDFYLTQHRDYEIQINSDLSFQDKQGTSVFGGNIKVLRSSFNIDALTEMSGGSRITEEPLLIQALKNADRIEVDTIIMVTDTTTQEKELRKTPSFMEHLSGSLKLEIPRNTWIKSDDMQMEIYGNLDVIKNNAYFELFGPLGVQRGFYTLYGKKMVIEEGDFTFTGGEEFNPILNVKANYVYRTPEREKKTLSLLVGGTLSDPDIRFEHERQEIPEADAIAYILFGQPFDQLNHGGQEGVSDAMSSALLSNLVTSQLSKTLGKTLNLDMVEIDASDNWQNTTFVVGKYITNDLFVTYQRSFGETDENEISPETITLEYELTKRLSVRLLQGKVKESGVDLIIKLEK